MNDNTEGQWVTNVTEMTETLNALLSMDWGVFLGGAALIIVVYPTAKKYLNDFEEDSGFIFPWTTRKRETDKKFSDVDNKINQRYEELSNKIKAIHEKEHIEQEDWRQESISVRNNLQAEQKKLEENQKQFIEALSRISASLEEIKSDFIEDRLERRRWNILNSATQLRNGNEIDIEQFNNVFRDYDSYEELIHRSGRKNGLIEESIKFIREKYQEQLNTAE